MMRQLTFILFLFLSALVLLESCQEVYYNDDLNAGELIPVVDARVTSFYDHQYVKLYYARPYNQDGYIEVSGATVRVVDDIGNTYNFNELYTGYYQTERGYLIGEPGIRYTLIIDMPDGSVLQSYPQVMPDTIGIQNLSYPIIEKEEIQKDANGEDNLVITTGYSYNITPRQPEDQQVYYRLKSDFYVYSVRTEDEEINIEEEDESGDSIFFARIIATHHFDCYEFFTNTELPIVGELNPNVKLSETERTIETNFLNEDFSAYTEYDFVEWVVLSDVYSISKLAYQYYNGLSDQLTAPDRIYDPIPNQLLGNMYCSSDTNKKVLGLFDVTAKSRRYNALYEFLSYGSITIQSRFYPDTTKYYNDCKHVLTTYDTVASYMIHKDSIRNSI
jgi:hypothetical protein